METLQRFGMEAALVFINEAIAEKLDIDLLNRAFATQNIFAIADLGCSVGPNTFITVQNIIAAVKLKAQSQSLNPDAIEFQVFFNDLISNDFNTLFKRLPDDRQYFAAGVPGSFWNCIFPKASLHYVHSSLAIHWLSEIPREVVDINSPAWNKGRIEYAFSQREVYEAYATQFSKDLASFLDARAHELVSGGLMSLIFPCIPDGTPHSGFVSAIAMDVLCSCLIDMSNEGLLKEDEVDSFNIPRYHPSPKEFAFIVEKNGNFSIEKMELLDRSKRTETNYSIEMVVFQYRAVLEKFLGGHFGNDMIDELFQRFRKKISASSAFWEATNKPFGELFVLLKHNS